MAERTVTHKRTTAPAAPAAKRPRARVNGPDLNGRSVVKVSTDSDPKAVAGAIAGWLGVN